MYLVTVNTAPCGSVSTAILAYGTSKGGTVSVVSGTDLSAEVGTDLLAVRVQAELGVDLVSGPLPACWPRILGRTGHSDGFRLAAPPPLQPSLAVVVSAGGAHVTEDRLDAFGPTLYRSVQE